MDSQQNTPNVTKTTELTDLEDRSRFLKSLGFARDQMTQADLSAQNAGSDNIEDDGVMLSSNFEDDLELPGAPMLMEPTRSLSELFGLGELDLEESPSDEIVPEIPTRFTEESSFDLSGVDDATWNAIEGRLRPEPANWKNAEADLEANLKKKTISPAIAESVVNSKSEAQNSPQPPPLEDDDDLSEVLNNSALDLEVEKAVEPPSNDDEPPHDESLTVNCPSCERGLTLQPEHLGIPGSCVWCETPIIAVISGVDHSVGVFRLAVEEPETIETSDSPEKPAAEIEHSKLADLPVPKTETPEATEPKSKEKEEVADSPVVDDSKEEVEPVATESQLESETEPDQSTEESNPTDISDADTPEAVEAISETKNNFPWNSPTGSKNKGSTPHDVPTPIEVDSKLLLDEITDPESVVETSDASLAVAPPFEVLPDPNKAEKTEVKDSSSEVTSVPPELDDPNLNSKTATEDSQQNTEAPAPVKQAASPFFDPPQAQADKPEQNGPEAEPISAASPLAPPTEKNETPTQPAEPASGPVDEASPVAPKATQNQTSETETQFKAVSPFDTLPETDEVAATDATNPPPIPATSPFGSTETTPVEDGVAPPIKSVSPFDLPIEETPAEDDAAPPIKSTSPFDLPTAETITPLSDSKDPLPELAMAAVIDSAAPPAKVAPAKDAPPAKPLPWDLKEKSSPPAADLPAAKIDSVEAIEPFPALGTEEALPPVNDAPEVDAKKAPASDSAPVKKNRLRKKKSSSKRSGTAITIALLGLISGAGIASFFLPVGGYIENAKSSWTEWLDTKIEVENKQELEALPTPANEPVAIPAPAPTSAPKPQVQTTSGDEPDPFRPDKVPGS